MQPSLQVASRSSGSLVYREFGRDTLRQLSRRGRVDVVFLDLWHNPYNCSFLLWRDQI